MHDVVGVHARDERAAAAREPGVERRHEAARRRRDDHEARVGGGERARPGERVVARAVVDDDALPIA